VPILPCTYAVATSRKVAVSIPDGVIEIFHYHNPSGRTMAQGSTHSVTEMSASNISWGDKGGRCVGLTHLPPSCADFHCLNFLQPTGPVQEMLYLYLLRTCIRRKGNGRVHGLPTMKLYRRNGGVTPPIHNLSTTTPVKPVWGLCSRAKFLALHRIRTSNHPARRVITVLRCVIPVVCRKD